MDNNCHHEGASKSVVAKPITPKPIQKPSVVHRRKKIKPPKRKAKHNSELKRRLCVQSPQKKTFALKNPPGSWGFFMDNRKIISL